LLTWGIPITLGTLPITLRDATRAGYTGASISDLMVVVEMGRTTAIALFVVRHQYGSREMLIRTAILRAQMPEDRVMMQRFRL